VILLTQNVSWRSLDLVGNNNDESKWWRDLRSIIGKSEGGNWFNKSFSSSVGKGNKIYLWDDV